MNRTKVSLVMVGHVDHGKSTLIGRILADTDSVAKDKMEELRKVSKNTGNELEYAFLLDHLREEREQGITIDTTQTFFQTENREYQIIDAPGHVEFVKNMITGTAQANSAVLIVDAVEGVMQQTKRHAYILSLLGIQDIIVAVNKMDKAGYSEERYIEVVKEIKEIFEQLRLSCKYFIPMSALKGDNVCKASENMKWYKDGDFLTIMESIEVKQEKRECPFIVPIQDVYKMEDKRIAVGRVECGELHTGCEIRVVQTEQITQVRSIERYLEKRSEAAAGECIGITTKDAIFLERGSVVCEKEADVQYDNVINANIIWLERENVQCSQRLIMRCSTQETACVVEEVYHKINTEQLTEADDNDQRMNYLDAGRVRIRTKNKLAVTRFTDCENTGRFVLLRNNSICANGIIL